MKCRIRLGRNERHPGPWFRVYNRDIDLHAQHVVMVCFGSRHIYARWFKRNFHWYTNEEWTAMKKLEAQAASEERSDG